jgi:hypothetical protein
MAVMADFTFQLRFLPTGLDPSQSSDRRLSSVGVGVHFLGLFTDLRGLTTPWSVQAHSLTLPTSPSLLALRALYASISSWDQTIVIFILVKKCLDAWSRVAWNLSCGFRKLLWALEQHFTELSHLRIYATHILGCLVLVRQCQSSHLSRSLCVIKIVSIRVLVFLREHNDYVGPSSLEHPAFFRFRRHSKGIRDRLRQRETSVRYWLKTGTRHNSWYP